MIHTPTKILVIRLSSIGDILLTTPLLRVLKKRYPEANIDFVTKKRYIDLVRKNPHLNQVLAFDEEIGFSDLSRIKRHIKNGKYDTIIDIHKNWRSFYLRSFIGRPKILQYRKYRIRRFILIKLGLNLYNQPVPVYQRYINSVKSLDVQDDLEGLEIHLDPRVQSFTNSFLQRLGLRTDTLTVGIAAGAAFMTKRWPPERFQKVAKQLTDDDGAQILLFGDTPDRHFTQTIAKAMGPAALDLAGRLTLMQTACAMAHCGVVVTNDTGLMHMASALKKRIVAIFGPTTEELGFFPVTPQSRVIQVDLSCRPCSHIGSHKCPKGHFRCMREISSDRVYAAVRDYLQIQ